MSNISEKRNNVVVKYLDSPSANDHLHHPFKNPIYLFILFYLYFHNGKGEKKRRVITKVETIELI